MIKFKKIGFLTAGTKPLREILDTATRVIIYGKVKKVISNEVIVICNEEGNKTLLVDTKYYNGGIPEAGDEIYEFKCIARTVNRMKDDVGITRFYLVSVDEIPKIVEYLSSTWIQPFKIKGYVTGFIQTGIPGTYILAIRDSKDNTSYLVRYYLPKEEELPEWVSNELMCVDFEISFRNTTTIFDSTGALMAGTERYINKKTGKAGFAKVWVVAMTVDKAK